MTSQAYLLAELETKPNTGEAAHRCEDDRGKRKHARAPKIGYEPADGRPHEQPEVDKLAIHCNNYLICVYNIVEIITNLKVMRLRTFVVGLAFVGALILPLSTVLADAPTLTIDKPATGNMLQAGVPYTFQLTPTGLGTGLTYTTSNTNSSGTITASNIDAVTSKVTWTPTMNELGVHTVTISVQDAAGLGTATTIQFIVNLPPASLSIINVSPGTTVGAGAQVSFAASSTNLSYPSYTILDNFSGTSVTSNNLNSTGSFSWTPTSNDIGTHLITLTAKDYHGSIANASVSITVTTAGFIAPVIAPAPVATQVVMPIVTPIVAKATVFVSPLKQGSSGAEVTALQNILIAKGYLIGEASGYYGALTTAAVAKLQSAHGLEPLGTVGPSTRLLLNSGAITQASISTPLIAPAAPSAPSSTMSSAERNARIAALRVVIQYLQSELNALVAGQ